MVLAERDEKFGKMQKILPKSYESMTYINANHKRSKNRGQNQDFFPHMEKIFPQHGRIVRSFNLLEIVEVMLMGKANMEKSFP